VRDGAGVIDAVSQFDPDLVVLDISMPVLNGLEAAARLQESGCRAKLLFLTVHNERDYMDAAFSAGASGYALKPRLGIDLLPAIREVLRGCTFFHLRNIRGGRSFAFKTKPQPSF
jgi:DNA-binding NarL/FixJ family response regulator